MALSSLHLLLATLCLSVAIHLTFAKPPDENADSADQQELIGTSAAPETSYVQPFIRFKNSLDNGNIEPFIRFRKTDVEPFIRFRKDAVEPFIRFRKDAVEPFIRFRKDAVEPFIRFRKDAVEPFIRFRKDAVEPFIRFRKDAVEPFIRFRKDAVEPFIRFRKDAVEPFIRFRKDAAVEPFIRFRKFYSPLHEFAVDTKRRLFEDKQTIQDEMYDDDATMKFAEQPVPLDYSERQQQEETPKVQQKTRFNSLI